MGKQDAIIGVLHGRPELPTDRILTADDAPAAGQAGGWRNLITTMYVSKFGRLPDLQPLHCIGEVRAYINHGRWMVRCPFCDHPAWAHDEVPHLCVECGNQHNVTPGRPVWIVFPKNRGWVEKVLLKRPDPATRNWDPDDKVSTLIRQHLELKRST